MLSLSLSLSLYMPEQGVRDDQIANMERTRVMSAREPCLTPLSFYALPVRRPENPGMATPPLRLPVSIPYNWEEAPGKPKKDSVLRKPSLFSGEQVRRLELPPRMLVAMLGMREAAKSNTIAVVHGRSSPLCLCHSFSLAEGRRTKKERVAVWRPWSKSRSSVGERKMSLAEGFKVESCDDSSSSDCSCSCSCSRSSTSDASSSFGQSYSDQEVANNMDQNKSHVRILRLRNRSLASVTTARLWASINSSMKQVMSWN